MSSYSFDLALKRDESATDKNKHFYSDMDNVPRDLIILSHHIFCHLSTVG